MKILKTNLAWLLGYYFKRIILDKCTPLDRESCLNKIAKRTNLQGLALNKKVSRQMNWINPKNYNDESPHYIHKPAMTTHICKHLKLMLYCNWLGRVGWSEPPASWIIMKTYTTKSFTQPSRILSPSSNG